MEVIASKQHLRRHSVPEQPVWQEQHRSYLAQLIGEYNTLIPNDVKSPAVAVADEIRTRFSDATKTKEITVDDVNTFELALLKLQSLVGLKCQAWQLRHRFRDVGGDVLYTAYLEAHPSKHSNEVDEETLRADLESILSEIHRMQRAIPGREELRRKLTVQVALVTLAIGLIALLVVICCSRRFISNGPVWTLQDQGTLKLVEENLIMGALAIISGSIGGYVSMQRRLQQLSSQTSFLALWHGRISLYTGPVGGAIFALVFYLLCLSGLLGTGSAIFPTVEGGIKEIKDVAKLLIGAFVSGFAERFVPDILDRVVAKRQLSKNHTGAIA